MIRVFCDFDGTVSQEDVGERFFRTFAGEHAEHNIHRLLHDEMTIQEWLHGLCEAIPSVDREGFLEFVDQFEIDPHFAEFTRFCKEQEISVVVLSDGLDAYVEHVLASAKMASLLFFANHAEFQNVHGRKKLNISFPYTDADCHRCGNCKRNHMLNGSADEDIIVYVGDGYSDRCPVRYADIVFAKRQLIKYCQEQNISYVEFCHFGDVLSKMKEIVQHKRLRHRQEAAMARREAFMQG